MHDYTFLISENGVYPNPKGFYLILSNVNRGPAHLGLLHAENYFSQSLDRIDIAKSFKPLWEAFRRKAIPVLLIELNCALDNQAIESTLRHVFQELGKPLQAGETCMLPVRQSLARLGIANIQTQTVFDLLQDPDFLKHIGKITSLNLEANDFTLNYYSYSDVKRHIELLSTKENNTL